MREWVGAKLYRYLSTDLGSQGKEAARKREMKKISEAWAASSDRDLREVPHFFTEIRSTHTCEHTHNTGRKQRNNSHDMFVFKYTLEIEIKIRSCFGYNDDEFYFGVSHIFFAQ